MSSEVCRSWSPDDSIRPRFAPYSEDKRGKEPDAHDERKRKYNVNHEVEVSEEEMEAYRMKKAREDEPVGKGTKGYDLV